MGEKDTKLTRACSSKSRASVADNVPLQELKELSTAWADSRGTTTAPRSQQEKLIEEAMNRCQALRRRLTTGDERAVSTPLVRASAKRSGLATRSSEPEPAKRARTVAVTLAQATS